MLVLDEATSSVDALTEVRIARALDKLAEGRTTIAIAHRLSTAARADRVLVLDHGRLVEDGHHAELLAAEGAYARMYDAWLAATTTAALRSVGGAHAERRRPVDVGDVAVTSVDTVFKVSVVVQLLLAPGPTSSTSR